MHAPGSLKRWSPVLLPLLMLLAACTAASTNAPTSSVAPSAGGPGGDLVIARAADGNTLDPAQGIGPDDFAPTNQIFDQLYRVSPDGSGIEDSLASSTTVSEDGLSWTITLRDDVSFSNGQPLTSADVKFSLDRSRSADAAFSFLLGPIASISTPDERTVVIQTEAPSATLKASLSAWVASILPKDFAGMSEKDFFAHPIGSGPFMFDSWEPGTSIKLVRNPSYWQEGKPSLDSVTWDVVSDPNTRIAQVQGGLANVASDIPFSQLESLDASSSLDATAFPANYTTFLIFNQAAGPFADIHVRRAIAYATNRNAITSGILFGAGEPACSMVPPTMPFYSAATQCLEYDLDKAKSEMATSSVPAGFSTELTIDNLPTSSSVAQIVQAELKEIGIDVSIKTVDTGQLYTVYDQGAFEMGLAAWASDIPDPDEQLTFMLDPNAGGNAYYTAFNDPEVIALLDRARTSMDDATRASDYAQVQQIAADKVPHLPIWNQGLPFVWSSRVQNLKVNPMGTILLSDVSLAGS